MIDGTRSGTRLLGSVVRAANDTLPLIADVSGEISSVDTIVYIDIN